MLETPESQSIQTKLSVPMLIYLVICLHISWWKKKFNFLINFAEFQLAKAHTYSFVSVLLLIQGRL